MGMGPIVCKNKTFNTITASLVHFASQGATMCFGMPSASIFQALRTTRKNWRGVYTR